MLHLFLKEFKVKVIIDGYSFHYNKYLKTIADTLTACINSGVSKELIAGVTIYITTDNIHRHGLYFRPNKCIILSKEVFYYGDIFVQKVLSHEMCHHILIENNKRNPKKLQSVKKDFTFERSKGKLKLFYEEIFLRTRSYIFETMCIEFSNYIASNNGFYNVDENNALKPLFNI